MPALPASRPWGPRAAPAQRAVRGEEEQRSERAFAVYAEARDAQLATTRRMPSDASARLWMEELETLN